MVGEDMFRYAIVVQTSSPDRIGTFESMVES